MSHDSNLAQWVATLQTNQRALESNNVSEASKSLRAFSLPAEQQAICLARAWTPPRMSAFSDNPSCHICHSKFAVFRRSAHCRNCGVCICKDCVVNWPARMIPETYNIKKESTVKICKACDWLCTQFRLALLEGNQDKAVALHATGNLNITCPFANVKGEEFYPVHCAVLGANLTLLKWLVESNCCPIKSVRVSGKSKDSSGKYTAVVTSRGRSLLGIALEDRNVHVVRYLVVQKGLSLYGESDITPAMLMRNLDAVLRLLPGDLNAAAAAPQDPPIETGYSSSDLSDLVPMLPADARSLSEEAQDFGATAPNNNAEECIICFDGKIDCVATPCGHQICCLKCSKNISRCPVCAQNCSFLRVFKP